MRLDASTPAPARAATRSRAALEVAVFAVLLASYIWVWKGLFAGHGVLVVALYLAIGAETHGYRGESARTIGFRLDNLAAFLHLAVVWVAPIVAVLVGLGGLLGGWAFPPSPALWLATLAWSVVWGTAQQYGLACVFYRRLRELLPPRKAMLASGLIFGALHLPNPFLVGLTLAFGVLSCFLYERHPNLIGLGLVHGVTSFFLANSLPGWLTFDWMVGPQILARVLDLL